MRITLPNRKTSGFTLVEMIISVAVFTAVMFVGTGAVLAVMDANQKTQSLKTVINNLNFAIDNMARTIRVGWDYRCDGISADCPSGGDSIALRAPSGSSGEGVVSFFLEDGTIVRDNGLQRANLTSPDIVVERLRFYVEGTERGAGDTKQPRVLMITSGYINNPDGTRTEFDLQTLVSQRIPDELL